MRTNLPWATSRLPWRPSALAGESGKETVRQYPVVKRGRREMGLKARNVLADCRNAVDLLEEETRPEVFQLYWVAGIALARTVGHVLQKVDGEHDDTIKRAVASAYAAWKADRQASAIFWDFIRTRT